jgi:hypothetical protein
LKPLYEYNVKFSYGPSSLMETETEGGESANGRDGGLGGESATGRDGASGGGIKTVSILWMTPLLATMSVMVTVALPSIITVGESDVIFRALPSSVVALILRVKSVDLTAAPLIMW